MVVNYFEGFLCTEGLGVSPLIIICSFVGNVKLGLTLDWVNKKILAGLPLDKCCGNWNIFLGGNYK
jgi:hypothetical protein